ncbi:hypothetical protein [Streptomyces sp. NPDC088812]|uniref:hypothetical protein n=1 Tax=Streptomyces sp. NPDC088812 TaxID=3365905 RepID=UPI00380EE8F8
MRSAVATVPARRRPAAYENWRPPVVGVSLLVPVGADCITVVDLRGILMLPVGGVYDGQTPEEAGYRVLVDPSGGLRLLRRVAVDWVQTRRRKVITHIMAAAPMTRAAATGLVYRDPRATVRVMSTLQFLDQWPTGRTRLLVSLQALATGDTVGPVAEVTVHGHRMVAGAGLFPTYETGSQVAHLVSAGLREAVDAAWPREETREKLVRAAEAMERRAAS